MVYKKIEDLKQIQEILLYILCNFHKICEENNLVYSLFAGTLLGAVRHKGFIPWDDDIDVVMPRNDYEKFVKIVKGKKYPGFNLAVPGDVNYAYPFGKFCIEESVVREDVFWPEFQVFGANIDVFPLDNYPDDEKECEDFVKHIRYDEGQLGRLTRPHSLVAIQHKSVRLHLLKKTFGITTDIRDHVAKVEETIQQYNCVSTKNMGCTWGQGMLRTRIEKAKFYDRCLYDFEGYKFWAPRDADSWLTQHFGNYMQLPPVSERIGHHGYDLFIDEGMLGKICEWRR